MIRLECLEGLYEGQVFEFDKSTVYLGRSSDCDLRLEDIGCSRKHACLTQLVSGYAIKDLDSTNGIRLNGTKVTESVLNYGDRFSVGKSLFIFLAKVPGEASEQDTVIERSVTLDDIEFRLLGESNVKDEVEATSEDIQPEELAGINRQLRFVYRLSRDINGTLNQNDLYRLIVSKVLDNFGDVERVCVFVRKQRNGPLEKVKSRARSERHLGAPVSRAVLRRTEIERAGILASDAQTDARFGESKTIIGMQLRAFMCVPLLSRDRFLGAIYAENCSRANCFRDTDLELLTVLGNQAAIAVENALLYEELQMSFYETVRGLSKALEAKDEYTRGHSKRVADYAVSIGNELGLPAGEIEALRVAAELHDIGKIAIGESIIGKQGKLSDQEFNQIKKHPDLGVEILRPISFLKNVLPAIRHHHERLDGSGYPDGLVGNEIPLLARILNLADAFDAMTTQRPYNQPKTFEEALAECEAESGLTFDKSCVDALARYIESEKVEKSEKSQAYPADESGTMLAAASPQEEKTKVPVREG